MPEVHSNENVAPWLELALTRQLGEVAAPAELWNRMQNSRVRPAHGAGARVAVFAVAAAAIIVTVSVLVAGWRVNLGRNDIELLALTNGSHALDFISQNPDDIERWVKVKTDIDIDLEDRNPAVRLLGARVVQLRGAPVAAISYRTGDDSGTLFVSKNCNALGNKPQAPAHALLKIAAHGKQVFSWNARDQSYTVAFSNPKNSRGACVLCHADSRGI